MLKYIALFETDEEADGVGVVFPDLPGCFSSGRDYEEAVKNAHEILADYLGSLKAEGKKIPAPRSLEQIKKEWKDWADWEKNYSFTVGFVRYIPVEKPRKYSIYMSQSLMAQIDAVTDNRSAFLAKAAEQALGLDPA